MPASNKQTTLWVADTLSWLLHFTRKFNLAIQSRFPDFRIITSFPLLILSYNGISKSRSSVTVTGSLRILTWFPLLTATRITVSGIVKINLKPAADSSTTTIFQLLTCQIQYLIYINYIIKSILNNIYILVFKYFKRMMSD